MTTDNSIENDPQEAIAEIDPRNQISDRSQAILAATAIAAGSTGIITASPESGVYLEQIAYSGVAFIAGFGAAVGVAIRRIRDQS